MPKFTPIYNRIGEKLIEAKNYLYEVVQKKLDEDKDQSTIIKEIKKEFAPNESVICDIENTFFKKANIDISETDFSKVSYIKKLPGKNKWRVYSESGKNMGTFDSESAAKKHLSEIEFFKRKKSSKNPYRKLSYNDLNLQVGDEVQIIKESTVVFNEFEMTLPEGVFGVVTKVTPLVAQFDIDDIGIYNIETNEINKEIVEKQFQDKYGHYFTVQLDEDVVKPVIELNKENIPIRIWNNKKAESWLEQAKPGDKVQLDGEETGEVTVSDSEKVEVRTPTKTETIWKKKQ